MLIKKEIKYGYSAETTVTTGKRRLVKPSNLTKIRLTPINSKFLFYGTRHDILKWMSLHSELLVIYDPIAKDDDELALSPPSSPLNSNFLDVSESLFSSPISITSPISPLSPMSPSSTASSLSSDSTISTNSISEKPHDIVFDLFTIPVKTSELLSDEATFNRPLNIALKCIPWIEVMLEIRPVNERKDSKLHPIHRVILPSGSSLSEISKALEKSWKSLIPDSTAFSPDCFIRNSELIYPQNKSKSDSLDLKTKGINSEEFHKSNSFMAGIAKRVPTVDLWLRQKQTSGVIPPGVLTPYIIDEVLEDLNEEKKKDSEKIEDKKKEAELDKELPKPDLPKYENIFCDVLLEKGQ